MIYNSSNDVMLDIPALITSTLSYFSLNATVQAESIIYPFTWTPKSILQTSSLPILRFSVLLVGVQWAAHSFIEKPQGNPIPAFNGLSTLKFINSFTLFSIFSQISIT